MIRDPLVDVLVVTAENRQLVARGEAHGVGLREPAATGAHEDNRRAYVQRLDGLEERRGPPGHPCPPPLWVILPPAVAIGRESAEVDDGLRHERPRPCPGRKTPRRRRGEEHP